MEQMNQKSKVNKRSEEGSSFMREISKRKIWRKLKEQSGFSMLELGVVLVIITILVLGALGAYNKIVIPTKANAYIQRVTHVVSAIERAKADNGGAYIATSGEITSIPDIANNLGGTGASVNDVIGWTYSCVAGSSSTVTITTTDIQPNVLRDLVLKKAKTSFVGASVSLSGNKLQIQISNVPCR